MDAESELARERAVLVDADRDLQQGLARIAAQERLVVDLRARGHDARDAERLLGLLRDTLTEWHKHRRLILKRIARLATELEAGKPEPAAPDGGA